MKEPLAAPVMGAAAHEHEPQDEPDVALSSAVPDDDEEEFQRAGVLARQPEDKNSSLKSFALACLLLAFIAVAVGIMYLKTNSNYLSSGYNVSDSESSDTTDQLNAAAAANPDTARSGQEGNADDAPAISAATTDALATTTNNEEPVETDTAALSNDFFDRPLPNDAQSDSPRTLSELLESASPFSPMDGIDDSLWKDKTCSECHAWTRSNLCALGQFYSNGDDSSLTRIQHPFDGNFKTALKNWANDDCG